MLWKTVDLGGSVPRGAKRIAEKFLGHLLAMWADSRGSAMLEYALMASGVGLAGTGMATFVGGDVADVLQHVQTSLCVQFKSLCYVN